MKKIILSVFLLSSLFAGAQGTTKGDPMPPFRMMLTSGRNFTAGDLKNDRPVVMIYFAPDCDHCLVLLEDFFKKIASFRDAEIVLITFKPWEQLVPFEKKYGTARFTNMHIGTEGYTFALRNYFRLQKTPFVALYNRQKRLVCSYREQTPAREIIACFKTIQ